MPQRDLNLALGDEEEAGTRGEAHVFDMIKLAGRGSVFSKCLMSPGKAGVPLTLARNRLA